MLAEAVGAALGHEDGAAVDVKGEVVADHVADLRVADDLCIGITAHGLLERLGVVRLHVVDHQVVRCSAVQDVGYIFTEGGTHGAVHRVEQDSLVVQQEIAVEADAVGHAEHTLEQGQTAAIRAHPGVVVVDFSDAIHGHSSFP